MSGPPDAGPERFGVFRVGAHRVAFHAGAIAEICWLDGLERMLAPSPAVIGALSVRGAAVPVVDMGRFSGLPDLSGSAEVGVVCTLGDRWIAFAVDAVAGLSEVASAAVERFAEAPAPGPGLLAGLFRTGGDLVGLIEPAAAFAAADIPSARAVRSGRRTGAADPAASYLIFDAGGARYAIDAIAVRSTVPRQPIAPEALKGGLCLGAIRHLGRRIPVVDVAEVTGLGRPSGSETAETVVLGFPGGRSLGFAVDHIRRIRTIPATAKTAAPASLARAGPFIRETARDGEVQVFLLEAGALTSDPHLVALADLSDRPGSPAAAGTRDTPHESGEVVPERRRYLVFQSGGAGGAVPVEEVVRVIPRPGRLTPAGKGAPLLGYFDLDGAAVPLVELAGLFGRTALPGGTEARVMIVGAGAGRMGLLVDRVSSIDTSAWRRPDAEGGGPTAGLVGFAGGGAARVLPCLAPGAIAGALAAPAGRG